jgi:hypothetical protein
MSYCKHQNSLIISKRVLIQRRMVSSGILRLVALVSARCEEIGISSQRALVASYS